jgi:hypothetical protein
MYTYIYINMHICMYIYVYINTYMYIYNNRILLSENQSLKYIDICNMHIYTYLSYVYMCVHMDVHLHNSY